MLCQDLYDACIDQGIAPERCAEKLKICADPKP